MIVGVGGFLMSLAPGTAHACTCAPRPTDEIVYDAAALVLGTPVSREEEWLQARYQVEVRVSFKQRMPQTITVLTASSSAACGVDFEIGEERMLVLGRTPGGLTPADGEWGASLCDNMGHVDLSDAILHAGPSIEPFPADDGWSGRDTAVAVGSGVVVLAGASALVLWWRRRA